MGDYVPVCVRIQKWRLNYLITLIDLFKSTKLDPYVCVSFSILLISLLSGMCQAWGSFRRFRHSDDLLNPSVQFKYQKASFCRATAGLQGARGIQRSEGNCKAVKLLLMYSTYR